MEIQGIKNNEIVRINTPKNIGITTTQYGKNMELFYYANGSSKSNLVYPFGTQYLVEIQNWLKLFFNPFVFDLTFYEPNKLTYTSNGHRSEASISFVANGYNNNVLESSSINIIALNDIEWDAFIYDGAKQSKVYWEGMDFIYSWLSPDLKTRYVCDNLNLIKTNNPNLEIRKLPPNKCSGYYLMWYGVNTDYYFWYFPAFEEEYSVEDLGKMDVFGIKTTNSANYELANQTTLGLEQEKKLKLFDTISEKYYELFLTLIQSPNVFVQKVQNSTKYNWERVFIEDQSFTLDSNNKPKGVEIELSFDKQYTVKN